MSEVTNSRGYDQMKALFSLKLALKNQATTDEVAKYTKELATSTSTLASSTKSLALATWGIALITLLSQIGLIVITLKAGK
jgi:hypothetical protein